MDRVWSVSVDALSEGYAKTVERLEAGEPNEALGVYRSKFLVTVKNFYSEASATPPAKFARVAAWSDWMRGLYVQSVQTDRALAALPAKGSAEAAAGLTKLDALRGHFAKLHAEAQRQTVSDFVYALREECRKAAPDVAALRKTQEALGKAALSKQAAAKPGEYKAAKAEWDRAAAPVLEKESVPADSLEALREAAEKFYRAFGVHLE